MTDEHDMPVKTSLRERTPEASFSRRTRPTTAVSLRPITEELLTEELPSESDLADEEPAGLAETTNPYHGVPGTSDDSSLALEVESYLRGLEDEGDDMSVNTANQEAIERGDTAVREQVLSWLEQLGAHRGRGVVHLPTSSATMPLRVIVDQGELCFGVELHEQPFLDVEFKREAPELFERLLALLGERRGAYDDPLMRCLVPRDAIALSREDERAIARQLLRVLFRSARASRGELRELVVTPWEGKTPNAVRFSPLDLFIACRLDNDPGEAPARRAFDALADRALEAWLLRLNERPHPFDALVARGEGIQHDLQRALAICDQLTELLTRTSQVLHTSSELILALEGDHFWACVIDADLVTFMSFPIRHMGRVLPTLQQVTLEDPS